MSESSQDDDFVRAVVLAGGSGTRLWPLSRQQFPKQSLRLEGERTLLDATIERLAPLVPAEQALVVTGADLAHGEAYTALAPYNTLLEPVGRNTAPAIALSAAWLQQEARTRGDKVIPPKNDRGDKWNFVP